MNSDRLFYLNGDSTSEDGSQALAVYAKKTLGGCDVLVNNAAIFIGGAVHNTSIEDFDKVFQVDVRGVFPVSYTHLIRKGCGPNTKPLVGSFCHSGNLCACLNGHQDVYKRQFL